MGMGDGGGSARQRFSVMRPTNQFQDMNLKLKSRISICGSSFNIGGGNNMGIKSTSALIKKGSIANIKEKRQILFKTK